MAWTPPGAATSADAIMSGPGDAAESSFAKGRPDNKSRRPRSDFCHAERSRDDVALEPTPTFAPARLGLGLGLLDPNGSGESVAKVDRQRVARW